MAEFYINRSGTRWVVIPKPKVQMVFPDGRQEERTVLEYEQFGNFASLQVKVKGKKIRRLVQSDGKIYLEDC